MADATPRADELATRPDESVVCVYLAQLTKLLESHKDPKQIATALAQRMGSKHFLSVLGTMTEMDRLDREMRSVLDEFTGRSYFLARILTIEHLATVMKLYVISWHTMLDLLARLVSAAFNLGIGDRDVSLRLVLNNDHVRSSRIPEILQEYEKPYRLRT